MKESSEQTVKKNATKWIEVIEVRSVGESRENLKTELRDFIKEIEVKINRNIVKAYYQATVEGDFSVHLIHQKKEFEKKGSELGFKLASALEEFGFVSHRIWIEL